MQVNSVSASSNVSGMAFRATPEEKLFASLKDRDIRNIAFEKASRDANDKKHRRIDNALFLALPLAGGLSAAVSKFSPEAIEHYGAKNIRAVRLARFGLVSTSWAAGLAALGALWGAKDYLANKVDIIKNNPVISFVATFAAGFGVLSAVNRLGWKGFSKALNMVEGNKYLPYLKRVRNSLNNNKIINKASEYISKFPSPIKDIGRNAAELAPLLVIGTQIAHMFSHQRAKYQAAGKNYEELKQAQEMIRNDIADEKINGQIRKKSIAQLHNDYEMMLKNRPIIDSQTKKPITFEQYVELATTMV